MSGSREARGREAHTICAPSALWVDRAGSRKILRAACRQTICAPSALWADRAGPRKILRRFCACAAPERAGGYSAGERRGVTVSADWPAAAQVARLQVLRLSALGDAVLCEPVIAALAARYPEAQLELVTRAPLHPLYAAHPAVHRCLTLAEARALPAPDLAVDLHNRWDTRRQAMRATHRRSWVKRDLVALVRAARGLPLHRGYTQGPHQVARMARDLGLAPLDRSEPRLHRPPTEGGSQSALAEGALGLVVGASRAVKMWPSAHFEAVGRWAQARGWPVVVIGGAAERPLAEQVADTLGCPALGLDQGVGPLMDILGACRVVLCNDSGPAHLAAALGGAVVTLFGPTAPGRWAPQGQTFLSLNPRCGPCSDHGERGCRQPRRWCLDDLSPEQVQAELVRAWARGARLKK